MGDIEDRIFSLGGGEDGDGDDDDDSVICINDDDDDDFINNMDLVAMLKNDSAESIEKSLDKLMSYINAQPDDRADILLEKFSPIYDCPELLEKALRLSIFDHGQTLCLAANQTKEGETGVPVGIGKCPVPPHRGGHTMEGGGSGGDGFDSCVSVQNAKAVVAALEPLTNTRSTRWRPDSNVRDVEFINARRTCTVQPVKGKPLHCPKWKRLQCILVAIQLNLYIRLLEERGASSVLVFSIAGTTSKVEPLFDNLLESPILVVQPMCHHIQFLSHVNVANFGSFENQIRKVTELLEHLSNKMDRCMRMLPDHLRPVEKHMSLISYLERNERLVCVSRDEKSFPANYKLYRQKLSDDMRLRHEQAGQVLNESTGKLVSKLWSDSIGRWRREHPDEYAAFRARESERMKKIHAEKKRDPKTGKMVSGQWLGTLGADDHAASRLGGQNSHANAGQQRNPKTGEMVSAHWLGGLGKWQHDHPEEATTQCRAGGKKGGKWSPHDNGTTDTVHLKSVKHGCEIDVLQSSFDGVVNPQHHKCSACGEDKAHYDFLRYPSAEYDEAKDKLDNREMLTCPKCKGTFPHEFKPYAGTGTRNKRTCPRREGGCGNRFRA